MWSPIRALTPDCSAPLCSCSFIQQAQPGYWVLTITGTAATNYDASTVSHRGRLPAISLTDCSILSHRPLSPSDLTPPHCPPAPQILVSFLTPPAMATVAAVVGWPCATYVLTFACFTGPPSTYTSCGGPAPSSPSPPPSSLPPSPPSPPPGLTPPQPPPGPGPSPTSGCPITYYAATVTPYAEPQINATMACFTVASTASNLYMANVQQPFTFRCEACLHGPWQGMGGSRTFRE